MNNSEPPTDDSQNNRTGTYIFITIGLLLLVTLSFIAIQPAVGAPVERGGETGVEAPNISDSDPINPVPEVPQIPDPINPVPEVPQIPDPITPVPEVPQMPNPITPVPEVPQMPDPITPVPEQPDPSPSNPADSISQTHR